MQLRIYEIVFIPQLLNKFNMKKWILGAMLLCSMGAMAQPDTTLVEQYARIEATPRMLSNKVVIDIDFG